jgi:hypothetical protein
MLLDLLQAGIDPMLLDLLRYLVKCYPREGWVITSSFRQGDPGVHGTVPCRAVDLRVWNLSENPEHVVASLNGYMEYDRTRPHLKVAILKDDPPHIHLQVHPRSKRLQSDG